MRTIPVDLNCFCFYFSYYITHEKDHNSVGRFLRLAKCMESTIILMKCSSLVKSTLVVNALTSNVVNFLINCAHYCFIFIFYYIDLP